jgi:hypothetical protein
MPVEGLGSELRTEVGMDRQSAAEQPAWRGRIECFGGVWEGAGVKSPFPGMDPYIEARQLWGDFHDEFIIGLKRAVQRQLPQRYVARVSQRTFVETDDPDLELTLRTRIGPDVEVLRRAGVRPPASAPGGIAVADPPLIEMRGQVEYEEREIFLDIYKLDPEKLLVTSIEVLSPSNKRRGSVGWDQYERKRNVFLHGHANLVEIDLLRGGTRHPMAEPWPESPYVIAVFRREKARRAEIWPAFSTQPLPTIPIPLLPPDADVPLALQPIVSEIFEGARYFDDMKYDQPIDPPLAPDEQQIVAQFLQSRKPE